MNEWLVSLVIFLLVMAAMAVGVLAGRKPIQGTCGGLSRIGLGGSCEICGKDPADCEKRRKES